MPSENKQTSGSRAHPYAWRSVSCSNQKADSVGFGTVLVAYSDQKEEIPLTGTHPD